MAKYDHGGGCACGLSRFCDCANATEQDRKDREAYDRMFGKKEKPVALKQMEDLYDGGHRNPPPNNAHPRTPFRGQRAFDLSSPSAKDSALAFVTMTGGRMDQNPSTGDHIVVFHVETAAHRDYLQKEWKLGMPFDPAPPTAKIEFSKEEIIFLSIFVDHWVKSAESIFRNQILPTEILSVQKKLARFKKEMET